MVNPSLYLDRAAPHFNNLWSMITDFEHQIEITLQNVIHREYTLRLFVESERENSSRETIEPGHPRERPYVPCLLVLDTLREGYAYTETFPRHPKMRTEIQMRSGHLLWANYRQTSEVID
jgi:hypothetical protein